MMQNIEIRNPEIYKTWEKQLKSSVHPMIKEGIFLDYEIDLDKEALFECSKFADCTFIGKDFNVILFRCILVNCQYPEEALNHSFEQCYITEGQEVDIKEVMRGLKIKLDIP